MTARPAKAAPCRPGGRAGVSAAPRCPQTPPCVAASLPSARPAQPGRAGGDLFQLDRRTPAPAKIRPNFWANGLRRAGDVTDAGAPSADHRIAPGESHRAGEGPSGARAPPPPRAEGGYAGAGWGTRESLPSSFRTGFRAARAGDPRGQQSQPAAAALGRLQWSPKPHLSGFQMKKTVHSEPVCSLLAPFSLLADPSWMKETAFQKMGAGPRLPAAKAGPS